MKAFHALDRQSVYLRFFSFRKRLIEGGRLRSGCGSEAPPNADGLPTLSSSKPPTLSAMLSDKAAVVTDSTSGIPRALAGAGANVLLNGFTHGY